MRSRTFVFLLLIVCPMLKLSAQTIDKSIIEKYNASVVAKVFDIKKYVFIDVEQQQQIAFSINVHDSMVSNWIQLGRNKTAIDSLQKIAQLQILGLLSKAQVQAYKENSTKELAIALATGEAEFMQEQYKPDSITNNNIRQTFINKYSFILQNFSENYFINKQITTDFLKKMNSVYDGYTYFPILFSKRYISDYCTKLTSIKKIPSATVSKIQSSFYNFLTQDNYTDWSLAAENATRMHYPDTAIFAALHRQELEQKAVEGVATEKHDMIYTHHISAGAFAPLANLVKEKHYTSALLQNTYALYYPQRYELLLKQNNSHYDSAVQAILIKDGSLQPTTQFALALKYKDLLHLRKTLLDTLVKHALYLARIRDSILLTDPFAEIDFGAYEATYLTPLLTQEQYNLVLFHKTRTYALANAETDWQEMVLRGLDKGFFKEETIKIMTDYYIIKNSAWTRYANDKITLWANLRTIDETKPKALKVLDPVRWSGATEKVKNNLQLKW